MIGAAMSATATSRNGHSDHPVGDGRLRREEPDPDVTATPARSLPARLMRALSGQVTSRIPAAAA